jgi:AbrB family looped-hinge helix DNA binding protein
MHQEATSSFYGVTTVGTKGQVVIPAEAREQMNLHPGDKVVIMGKKFPTEGFGMVCICPISTAEKFVESLTAHLSLTQAALKKAKEQNP